MGNTVRRAMNGRSERSFRNSVHAKQPVNLKTRFTDIPNELVLLIVRAVDVDDRRRISKTCRQFCYLIRQYQHQTAFRLHKRIRYLWIEQPSVSTFLFLTHRKWRPYTTTRYPLSTVVTLFRQITNPVSEWIRKRQRSRVSAENPALEGFRVPSGYEVSKVISDGTSTTVANLLAVALDCCVLTDWVQYSTEATLFSVDVAKALILLNRRCLFTLINCTATSTTDQVLRVFGFYLESNNDDWSSPWRTSELFVVEKVASGTTPDELDSSTRSLFSHLSACLRQRLPGQCYRLTVMSHARIARRTTILRPRLQDSEHTFTLWQD